MCIVNGFVFLGIRKEEREREGDGESLLSIASSCVWRVYC